VSTPPQALFVSYTSLLGGAERILLDHATALPGPVALACPEGPLAERARAGGIAVVTIADRPLELRASLRDRLATPLRIGGQARELRRIVAELQPRCTIASGMRALLSCAAGLAGVHPRVPLVFQHNDLLPSGPAGRAVRAAARRADLVVALSQAIADDLDPNGRFGARVTVVRPGVDLDRFAPAALPAAPTALVLGAIVPWKRPDLALEAVALAARELPDLRLRLAGAPIGAAGAELRARLESRAARPDLAGRIEISGQVDDVPTALASSTCLLHCADREPYGMALVEALACGRPVVAPAAAGPPEIVDASCGVLYRPGDAPAAAAALVDVLGRAPEMSPAARTRAEAHFDATTARTRFAALVEDIAR
jgi:glycosyltransferase involved in cell wall biosynthesis